MVSSLLLGCSEPDETKALLSALEQDARPNQSVVEIKKSGVDINPRLLRRFRAVRSQIESSQNPLLSARVELGRMLYFEERLSKNQELSCNSCHKLDDYGADREATSTGHLAQKGTRNAPTVYNAAGFFAQFWDGRMETVEQQAVVPILNPVEMALPSAERAVRS